MKLGLFLFLNLYAVFFVLELPASWFTVTLYLSSGRDNFTFKGKFKHCLFIFACNICIQSGICDYICIKCFQWNTADTFCWHRILNDLLFIYCPKCLDAAWGKKAHGIFKIWATILPSHVGNPKGWLIYCKTTWPNDVQQMLICVPYTFQLYWNIYVPMYCVPYFNQINVL